MKYLTRHLRQVLPLDVFASASLLCQLKSLLKRLLPNPRIHQRGRYLLQLARAEVMVEYEESSLLSSAFVFNVTEDGNRHDK